MFALALVSTLLVAPSATQAQASRVDAMVRGAIAAAVQPGDKVTIDGSRLFLHKACKATEATLAQRLESSGRVGVRLAGTRRATQAERAAGRADARACSGFAWAQVRLKRRALVVAHDVERGESLASAVATRLVEVKAGRTPLSTLGRGAVATRRLKAGQPLMTFMVRAQESKPGAAVPVHIMVGNIRMVVPGTAVRCGLRHACARLQSGKLVKGRAEGGAVVVEGGLR